MEKIQKKKTTITTTTNRIIRTILNNNRTSSPSLISKAIIKTNKIKTNRKRGIETQTQK